MDFVIWVEPIIGVIKKLQPKEKNEMIQTLNLTQHNATPDQLEAGVMEPSSEMKKEIQTLLTFDKVPDLYTLLKRAELIAGLAENTGHIAAMIGGAPFFMRALENALKEKGITPVYSFTLRETVEEQLEDGSVKKTAVFRHSGWVTVIN
jgi:hypothetical protein